MLQHKKRIALTTTGVALAVAVLGAYILPSVTKANAEGTNTEVILTVKPYISITATESLDLEIVPTVAGTFTSGDIAVNINTNDAAGYSLYLSSSSEETALVNSITSASIPTVTSAATSEEMANNTWGWALGDTFNPIPGSASAIKIKETATPAVTTDATTVTSRYESAILFQHDNPTRFCNII